MPDSINSCGELIAPPHMITSFLALIRLSCESVNKMYKNILLGGSAVAISIRPIGRSGQSVQS